MGKHCLSDREHCIIDKIGGPFVKRPAFVLFVILFIGGCALGLFGRAICTRDNRNYAGLQPESFVPDVIDTVLHDEECKQIYVCYDDANCVNVYSESGEFLWAVATPYMRNSCFALQDDRLIIYDGDAYVYNAKTGAFLGIQKEEDLDLPYDWEHTQTDEYRDGEFYFDSYQVYRADADGTLRVVVARPWWHWIFNFAVAWFVSFAGALGVGVTLFIEQKRSYNGVKKRVKITDRKARTVVNYFRITSVIQLVFALLNVIFGVFGRFIGIGILPIGIHFIVSNWVLWNVLDCLPVDREEGIVLHYWKVFEIATFIIAFLSVIIIGVAVG